MRVTVEWNNLPDSVKDARNVTNFKCLYTLVGGTERAQWHSPPNTYGS